MAILFSCKPAKMKEANIVHVIRLKPGEDLKASLSDFVSRNKIEAGWIVTCVGSLPGILKL